MKTRAEIVKGFSDDTIDTLLAECRRDLRWAMNTLEHAPADSKPGVRHLRDVTKRTIKNLTQEKARRAQDK